jgi:putative chitinase
MHDQQKFAAAVARLWPHSDITIKGLGAGIIDTATVVFPEYGWDSDLLVCHAMAQFSEETDCGREMQENMNYTAARLLQVFPTHFSHDDAIRLQHQPRLIADRAYGGRMGNAPPPSDDGWNCRGQGLSQLTGAANYRELQKRTGIPVYDKPETLLDPKFALAIGVADLTMCGCLPHAQKDDLLGVSALLNVGHLVSNPNAINGFHMREAWLGLWKHAMGVP